MDEVKTSIFEHRDETTEGGGGSVMCTFAAPLSGG